MIETLGLQAALKDLRVCALSVTDVICYENQAQLCLNSAM